MATDIREPTPDPSRLIEKAMESGLPPDLIQEIVRNATRVPQIYGLIAEIQNEVEAVGKTQYNKAQEFYFRSVDQIYDVAHRIFAKYKVFSTSTMVQIEREAKATQKGGISYRTWGVFRYQFWAPDGSHVDTEVAGEGMDSGDKAPYKLMAGCHKYAIAQMLSIPFKDMPDPDRDTGEPPPSLSTLSEAAPPETMQSRLMKLRPRWSQVQKATGQPDSAQEFVAWVRNITGNKFDPSKPDQWPEEAYIQVLKFVGNLEKKQREGSLGCGV
jgi:hypothetical protein